MSKFPTPPPHYLIGFNYFGQLCNAPEITLNKFGQLVIPPSSIHLRKFNKKFWIVEDHSFSKTDFYMFASHVSAVWTWSPYGERKRPLEDRGEPIVFWWPNTNTNIIWLPKSDQIRIWISFGFQKMTEYEYYLASQKRLNTNTNIIQLPKLTEYQWEYYLISQKDQIQNSKRRE